MKTCLKSLNDYCHVRERLPDSQITHMATFLTQRKHKRGSLVLGADHLQLQQLERLGHLAHLSLRRGQRKKNKRGEGSPLHRRYPATSTNQISRPLEKYQQEVHIGLCHPHRGKESLPRHARVAFKLMALKQIQKAGR